MTTLTALRFFEATSGDAELKQEVASVLGVGDGDISNAGEIDEREAQALAGQRAVEICALAEMRGFLFTMQELQRVVLGMREWRDGCIGEAELIASLDFLELPSVESWDALDLTYRGISYAKPRAEDGNRLDVVRFFERTAKEDALRRELQSLLQAGDGDISSFHELDDEELRALKTERGMRVVEFAQKLGYSFHLGELYTLLDAFQRMKKGELSEEGFERYIDDSSAIADSLPAIAAISELTYMGASYERVIPKKDSTLGVVNFMQKTNEEGLRQQLQAIIGGDGDISTPDRLDAAEATQLLGARSEQVVLLGAQEGFRFTIEDLNAAVGAFRMVEEGKISPESCYRILGIDPEDAAPVDTVVDAASRMYRGSPLA
ncbi:MAG: hypothetical protein AAGA95_16700 [Pseudomonadota bacterium]